MKVLRIVARIALVSTLLVVIAGSVVRMTGSGMGCPDWPKCFGYYIPPTDEATVQWQADRDFKKGQMIVHENALWVAVEDFRTAEKFEESHWELYEKHDYAIFNVTHTWTEYINRLLGAFSGIPVLLLLILSLRHIKKDPLLPLLAALVVFMLGFEAWLGKTVVDSNLAVYKISLHMAGALAIVALLIFIIRRASERKQKTEVKAGFRYLLVAALFLGLIQIGLGTQVRENVDELLHEGVLRSMLLERFGADFFVHRSFAQLVVVLTGVILWFNYKRSYHLRSVYLFGAMVLLEAIGGIILSYANMPAIVQPMHLFFAFLMFAFSFDAILGTRKQ